MTLSAAAFALMTSVDTIFKLMSGGHPIYQLLFVNAVFALLPVFVWAMMTGGVSRLHTLRPTQHFARAAVSLMSSFAAVYAYSRVPLTDFYAIVFAGPLVVTALSSLLLGEQVGKSRWIAIAVGFTGILIVIFPIGHSTEAAQATQMFAGRLAAIVNVLCYAFSVIMIRRMRLGESSLAFSFYGYGTSLIITGVLLMLKGAPALAFSDILYLALSGTLAGIATICLIAAYHRSPVALVAPFQYTQIIWGAVAGYLIWSHVPEARLIMGATVVAACGLFIIYRELRGEESDRRAIKIR